MATATVDSRNKSVFGSGTGTFTGDGAATKITLGFNPSYMIVINETDGIRFEKMKNMSTANSLKLTSAADLAVDTTSAILFNGDGTVTLSSGLGVTGKKIVWYAER